MLFRRDYGPNLHAPSLRKRAILKNGEYNIIKPKFENRYVRYFKDIFTSLVDAEWKWLIQVVFVGFIGTWFIFALLWWLIAFVHTDLWDNHLPPRQVQSGNTILIRQLFQCKPLTFLIVTSCCLFVTYTLNEREYLIFRLDTLRS